MGTVSKVPAGTVVRVREWTRQYHRSKTGSGFGPDSINVPLTAKRTSVPGLSGHRTSGDVSASVEPEPCSLYQDNGGRTKFHSAVRRVPSLDSHSTRPPSSDNTDSKLPSE